MDGFTHEGVSGGIPLHGYSVGDSVQVPDPQKHLHRGTAVLPRHFFWEMERVITLDVGGKVYKTTQGTLRKYGDHMLSRLPFQCSEVVFIDRNGNLFEYVLDFLRSGFVPELDSRDLLRLSVEADFFCIERLKVILREKKGESDARRIERQLHSIASALESRDIRG